MSIPTAPDLSAIPHSRPPARLQAARAIRAGGPTLLLLLAACLLSACAETGVAQYSEQRPRLTPQDFFDGNLSAHGVVKNRAGEVIRGFNADILASWRDGTGTLEEDFVFDDGERQRRVWTLEPRPDGSYKATAGDVVGPGSLHYAGNSIFLDYVLRIPWRDGSIDVRVDDRMYLVDRNIVINESRLSKFGIDVGSLLLTIIRHPDGAASGQATGGED